MCYNNSSKIFQTTPEVSVKSSCSLLFSSTTALRGRSILPALFLGAGALFLVGSMQAQDSGLQARQVYYKPQEAAKVDPNAKPEQKQTEAPVKNTTRHTPPKKTTNEHTIKVEPPPLGLKYVMEQVQPTGGAIQVDPDRVFSTGDGIRLRVEVNTDAYVYLLTQESSGEWKILFPEAGENNHFQAYQSVEVPAASADPIVFAEPAGSENLYIRVSRTPINDLQKLIPKEGEQGQKMPTVPKSQMDDLQKTEKLQGRDLTRGKVSPADTSNTDKNEWAFYVVNNSPSPSAQVIQKFQLRHK